MKPIQLPAIEELQQMDIAQLMKVKGLVDSYENMIRKMLVNRIQQ